MWDQLDAGDTESRVGKFTGRHRLNAGDLRTIVANLNAQNYPDDCPVQITTPLPPRDRRVVDITVHDFTPKGNPQQ